MNFRKLKILSEDCEMRLSCDQETQSHAREYDSSRDASTRKQRQLAVYSLN